MPAFGPGSTLQPPGIPSKLEKPHVDPIASAQAVTAVLRRKSFQSGTEGWHEYPSWRPGFGKYDHLPGVRPAGDGSDADERVHLLL
jgi:hypothetical protein